MALQEHNLTRTAVGMRTRVRIVSAVLVASVAAFLAAPASALAPEPPSAGDPTVIAPARDPFRTVVGIVQPQATGQYEATCINLGRGYAWNPSNVPNCPGYLYIYISGNQVAKLNTGGGSTHSWQCDLKIASGVLNVFIPGKIVVGWAAKGLLYALGIAYNDSCKK